MKCAGLKRDKADALALTMASSAASFSGKNYLNLRAEYLELVCSKRLDFTQSGTAFINVPKLKEA